MIKSHLGRHRYRWEDSIRMDAKEIGIKRGIRLIRPGIEIITE